jgi:broad specificity phosphatase PhoE
MKPIIIIRHGQAENNLNTGMGGWSDPSLTELGREQAMLLAKRLKRELEGLEFKLYTSVSKRAQETAQIIGKELAVTPIIEVDLQEYRTGLGAEVTREQARELTNELTQPIKDWRPYRNGESFAEMYSRAGGILTKITNECEDVVLIVSHMWFIDKIISWWLGVSINDIKPLTFLTTNASISILSYTKYDEKTLERLNDTLHLHTQDFNKPTLDLDYRP